jgi:hypothetical protein
MQFDPSAATITFSIPPPGVSATTARLGQRCRTERPAGRRPVHRSGHFGQVLARQRKIDLDARFGAPAAVAQKSHEGARDAPLDALAGRLAQPVLHLAQPPAYDPDHVEPDLGIAQHELGHHRRRPADLDALGHRLGIGRKPAAGVDRKRAEHLARIDEPHHQMLAAGAGLDDLHPPVDERMAGERLIALREDARALRHPAGAGVTHNVGTGSHGLASGSPEDDN